MPKPMIKSRRRKPKVALRIITTSADLENVRKKGYAVDREESVTGGICFGAPIFDERRQAVAAMSVSRPVIRMSKEREQETIRAVLEQPGKLREAIQADLLFHAGEVKGRTV